jgi:uncharacterized protein (TIGR03083 family)
LTPRLSADAYADALVGDGAALADAAKGNLALPVASCPGWNVSELVWHIGGVHHFWGEIAERGLQSYDDVVPPERPEDEALVAWFRAGFERLAEVLRAADPEMPVWTWSHEKKTSFIQRRMAQETAVHRWDAQVAAGEPDPIDALLAVDGVDEFFDFLDLFIREEHRGGERDSVHLHSTDAHGEWLVTVSNGIVDVRRGHEKAEVAVRGPASDILLLLWRRILPSHLEVLGDAATLDRFLARPDLD